VKRCRCPLKEEETQKNRSGSVFVLRRKYERFEDSFVPMKVGARGGVWWGFHVRPDPGSFWITLGIEGGGHTIKVQENKSLTDQPHRFPEKIKGDVRVADGNPRVFRVGGGGGSFPGQKGKVLSESKEGDKRAEKKS